MADQPRSGDRDHLFRFHRLPPPPGCCSTSNQEVVCVDHEFQPLKSWDTFLLLGESVTQNTCKSHCGSSRRPGTQRRFRFRCPEQLFLACHKESVTAPPSPEEEEDRKSTFLLCQCFTGLSHRDHSTVDSIHRILTAVVSSARLHKKSGPTLIEPSSPSVRQTTAQLFPTTK